jgi:magnesium chelatase subunit H
MDISNDKLEELLGDYMFRKVRRAWPEKERGPGVSSNGNLVVSGLQLGKIFITVQPLLGVEGDPMRLLFERDLTPHPQYCAAYEIMKSPESTGGIGAQAVIHFGMHGTVEWLPGQSLGNDRQSWSDQLIGPLPNLYLYCANNPSESILAKRRGYATVISYNVPPVRKSSWHRWFR